MSMQSIFRRQSTLSTSAPLPLTPALSQSGPSPFARSSSDPEKLSSTDRRQSVVVTVRPEPSAPPAQNPYATTGPEVSFQLRTTLAIMQGGDPKIFLRNWKDMLSTVPDRDDAEFLCGVCRDGKISRAMIEQCLDLPVSTSAKDKAKDIAAYSRKVERYLARDLRFSMLVDFATSLISATKMPIPRAIPSSALAVLPSSESSSDDRVKGTSSSSPMDVPKRPIRTSDDKKPVREPSSTFDGYMHFSNRVRGNFNNNVRRHNVERRLRELGVENDDVPSILTLFVDITTASIMATLTNDRLEIRPMAVRR